MTSMKTLTICLWLALSLLGASQASAQADAPSAGAQTTEEDDAEEIADSRATGFRAVDGAQVEDVPGGLMLVGAYGAIAILLLLFLFRQQSQLGALSARIDSLRSEIDKKRAEHERT
jgi:hypothetical protein